MSFEHLFMDFVKIDQNFIRAFEAAIPFVAYTCPKGGNNGSAVYDFSPEKMKVYYDKNSPLEWSGFYAMFTDKDGKLWSTAYTIDKISDDDANTILDFFRLKYNVPIN